MGLTFSAFIVYQRIRSSHVGREGDSRSGVQRFDSWKREACTASNGTSLPLVSLEKKAPVRRAGLAGCSFLLSSSPVSILVCVGCHVVHGFWHGGGLAHRSIWGWGGYQAAEI